MFRGEVVKTPGFDDLIRVSDKIAVKSKGVIKEQYFNYKGKQVLMGNFSKAFLSETKPPFIDWSVTIDDKIYLVECVTENDKSYVKLYREEV